jgi:hydroxymethylpyrimidine pyrophosphatase-like HAD family hydrolase
MRFAVATARPPRNVAELLPAEFPSAVWICHSGAETHERGARIAEIPLTPQLLRRVLSTLRVYAPDSTIQVEIDDESFANRPLPWDAHVVDLETLVERTAAKVLFDSACCEDVEALRAELAGACKVLITDRGSLGQIVHADVSKAHALASLLDRWERTWADVVAFGVDVNDIEMIVESSLGVAMGNARPELKAVADHLTLSKDEDGVALVLETLLDDDGDRFFKIDRVNQPAND